MITEIAKDLDIPAKSIIDAENQIVSSGFIDIHSHSDLSPFFTNYKMQSKLYQGISLEIVGNCGISCLPTNDKSRKTITELLEGALALPLNGMVVEDDSITDYAEHIERCPAATNVGLLVGHEVGEDLNWKRNLIVLWCCVFLVCASYTMVIPFLPLFLLKELQLPVGVAKMWSGGIIAITFVVAGIMAPFWGARGDVIGQKKNALRAGIGLGLCYFLSGMKTNPPLVIFVKIPYTDITKAVIVTQSM